MADQSKDSSGPDGDGGPRHHTQRHESEAGAANKAAGSSAGHRPRTGASARAASALDPQMLVEVYRTDNDIVAGLVVDEILRPAGIYAAQHDRRSHSIVAPASMPGEIGIAVRSDQAKAARARLAAARRDGVLVDGELVEEELA